MSKFTLYLDKIAEWTCTIFKWGLAILMLLIVFEVTSRYVFHEPTIWGLDMQTQIFGVCMMIGMGYTLQKRGHVIVDILTVRLPTRNKAIVDAIGYLIWLFPMVLSMVYTWWGSMLRSWKFLEKSTSPWMPPVYQFKTLLFLAFALLLIQCISEFIKMIITAKKGDDEWLAER